MNPNNPFGMEIDDDGLPKYSPDRKNIAAYHMYKLGLTDKLPDPEDTHTPFFRTPSYYEEKARRERQAQAGLSTTFEGEQARPDPPGSDMTDLYKGRPFDVGGEGVNPPASRQKPFVPDTNAPYGQMGQAGQQEKEAPFGQQVEKGQNSQPPLDTKAFGREVLGRIFGEVKPVVPNGGLDGGLQKQPFSGTGRMGEPQQYASPKEPVSPESPDTPEKGVDWSGQASPSESRTRPVELNRAMPLPVQADEKGSNMSLPRVDEAIRAIQGKSDMPDMSARVSDLRNPAGYRTLELKSGEREKDEGPWSSGLFPLLFFRPELIGKGRLSVGEIEAAGLSSMEEVPVQYAEPAKEEAPGWMNGDSFVAGSQEQGDVLPDGDFSVEGLEAPSAGGGRKKGFESVFANDNTANPGFAPMQVAIIDPKELPIRGDRREVSIDMTHDINSRLTRLNRGWPIGINFTVLSRLEGGSNPRANLPIAKKELDLERRLIEQDRKNGTNLAKTTKWANRSGVTIGSGFDLGQTSVDEMRGMGFPESLIGKCAPYIGKKRVAADDELRKKPLILTHEEIDFVNHTVMLDKAQKSISDWDSRIALLRKTNPNAPFFHEMNSTQQTIVFSRYYHQGPGWINKTANRPMFEAMKKNDWATVNRQLQGLVNRLEKSGPRWLWTRFTNELEFLDGKYNKP